MDHGYWANPKKIHFADFGTRAKDLISLASDQPNISHDNSFKIAVIGDSLVWGQGLKNNDRFVVLLTKKLNQIRPTTVYSLGGCGDNIFDDYMKYKKSIDVFGKVDLYIFGLFNNDLLLNEDDRYSTKQFISQNLVQGCPNKTIFDPNLQIRDTDEYSQSLQATFATDSTNLCAYKNLVPLLPKDNSIYIDLGNIFGEWTVQDNFSKIISHDFNLIKAPNLGPSVHISHKESHPNALANQMYADILFNEITSNSKWNFKK